MRRSFLLKAAALAGTVLAGDALRGGPAMAQGKPLTIGYQEQPDWLLFAARELRMFEKAGLSPSFIKFEAGPPMIEAIKTGAIDLASLGSVAFLIGLSVGVDWTMIGINPEGAFSQGLVARKDSGIKTPADLRGKKVGVFKGATAQYGLLMMLRQHGVKEEQVITIHMTPQQQLEAMVTKQIDAAMVWEPWMQRMIHTAHSRIVETEGNLGIYTNVDCYSVRHDWLKVNRDIGLRFLRALVMTAELVKKEPRLALNVWARELGLKEAWAEAIYDVVPPPLVHEWTNPRYTYSLMKHGPLYQRLTFLANYMLQEGLIKQPVDLSDAMDPSLIAEVLKQKLPPR